MAQKFSYAGPVTISHINARKEGPDDDKVLAVDLKLSLVSDASILDRFDDMLSDFVFTDINAVRNTMVGPIPFLFELENYRLEAVGGTFFGVKVKKFTVKPMDGYMAEVCFQVSFAPSGDEVARMAEFLQEEMDIRLEPANDELDLDSKETAVDSVTYGSGLDPLYNQAVEIVVSHQRASISFVQRHLRIGYNRAARLIESMERAGLVGTMDKNGNRDVLKAAA